MPPSSVDLIDPVLAGNTRAMARLISRAEAGTAECRPALEAIYRHSGRAHLVGLTGVPGSGKSTLLDSLVQGARQQGRQVAVVAVDPSSPFSGGSILGDRIRMNALSLDPGVFIRSMATRGALGGLARATYDAVDILDAGGYDLILIETVGVGQDEVDIVQAAHTVVVISAPGLGDEIQAIKAGVMEIADIHVVSKCDRADANRTLRELKNLLTMGPGVRPASAWEVPVLATSALEKKGLNDLLGLIDQHRETLVHSGELLQRQQEIARTRMLKTAATILHDNAMANQDGHLTQLVEQVVARRMNPHTAALQLITALPTGTA